MKSLFTIVPITLGMAAVGFSVVAEEFLPRRWFWPAAEHREFVELRDRWIKLSEGLALENARRRQRDEPPLPEPPAVASTGKKLTDYAARHTAAKARPKEIANTARHAGIGLLALGIASHLLSRLGKVRRDGGRPVEDLAGEQSTREESGSDRGAAAE